MFLQTTEPFIGAPLIDQHGRRIHKVRISLLDTCNFRCLYCMPKDNFFLKQKNLLTQKQLLSICKNLAELGIDEFRLTGGEPLLRPDIKEIINQLDHISGIKKIGLTTNALNLEKHLPELVKTKCQHLNISLDALDRVDFHKITRVDGYRQVMSSILKAKELGFNVKINMVAMKGINDHHLVNFVNFSAKYDIEVRFLEVMKIGVMINQFENTFFPSDKIIKLFLKQWQFEKIDLPLDSTSYNFRLSNGANIGFISSESNHFCGKCSRLRLNANGTLRPCLMVNEGTSLVGLNLEQTKERVTTIMGQKPITRIREVTQPMYQIGG